MKKPVIVRAEAEADLAEAYQWYEHQVSELGGAFLLCVEAVMASIERNPQLYPVVHKGVIRRALTRRFPYGIFFIEGERNVSGAAKLFVRRRTRSHDLET